MFMIRRTSPCYIRRVQSAISPNKAQNIAVKAGAWRAASSGPRQTVGQQRLQHPAPGPSRLASSPGCSSRPSPPARDLEHTTHPLRASASSLFGRRMYLGLRRGGMMAMGIVRTTRHRRAAALILLCGACFGPSRGLTGACSRERAATPGTFPGRPRPGLPPGRCSRAPWPGSRRVCSRRAAPSSDILPGRWLWS